MRITTPAILVVAAVAFTGCAHQISLTPDSTKLPSSTGASIQKNVGYYISPEDKAREVITPGGGGDKVSDHPFRDLESGFYKALSNVFANVTALGSANDQEAIKSHAISYVFTPNIVPHSNSDSLVTWPPTSFQIELNCVVFDADAKEVARVDVVGNGAATFDEFRSNFGLAGQRAGTDALLKFQGKLLETKALTQ